MEGLLLDVPFTPGDTINYSIFSDLHLGAIGCAKKQLKQTLERRAALPNPIFSLIGDFGDWIVNKSDPRYQPGQSTAGNRADIVNHTIDEVVDTLKGYPWAFIGIGNHEQTLLMHGGVAIYELLMEKLGNPPAGQYSGFARFRFQDGYGSGAACTFTDLYHHGFTGGRGKTTPPPSLQDWAAGHDGMDVVSYGHNHRLACNWIPRDFMNSRGVIKHRNVAFVNTGTYLLGEPQGSRPGYGEQRGYPPVMIGSPLIHIRPDRGNGVRFSVETGDC